jgi:hypothetical protein
VAARDFYRKVAGGFLAAYSQRNAVKNVRKSVVSGQLFAGVKKPFRHNPWGRPAQVLVAAADAPFAPGGKRGHERQPQPPLFRRVEPT